jgi:hypothetical protein
MIRRLLRLFRRKPPPLRILTREEFLERMREVKGLRAVSTPDLAEKANVKDDK